MANQDERLCVLVVDDDSVLRATMVDALGLDGYVVHHASNGAVGLEKALLVRPDVVVAEFVMTVVGGAELIESVRTLLRPTPAIVVMSAFVGAARWCDDNGVEVFLAKPFSLDSFLLAVAHGGARMLESHASSRSGLRAVVRSACVMAVGEAAEDLHSTLPAAIRHARVVVVDSPDEAMQILGELAPELLVVSADPKYAHLKMYAALRGIPCIVREDPRRRNRAI
jgi:CheY-like chemotaxis protein